VVSGELRFECSDVGCRPSNVAIPPNGRVFFECDGAMSYAMLYLDGKFLGGWPYGYTRWRVDLTEGLKKGTYPPSEASRPRRCPSRGGNGERENT